MVSQVRLKLHTVPKRDTYEGNHNADSDNHTRPDNVSIRIVITRNINAFELLALPQHEGSYPDVMCTLFSFILKAS